MKLLAFTVSEMGLGIQEIVLIVLFALFFIISFALTSRNMDTKGLLRVLYAKPLRKKDGSVEYRD